MTAQPQPKYAAKVPEAIQTPDVVETSRLGRLDFFDGMPAMATGITPAMAHSGVGKESAYAFTPHDAQFWSFVVILRTAPQPAGDRPEARRRRQPEPGSVGQPGWHLHRLVRADRVRRQGGQLGADHARQELVGPAAPLRAARALVRQVVEARRLRACQRIRQTTKSERR